jgi:hypothetical protein
MYLMTFFLILLRIQSVFAECDSCNKAMYLSGMPLLDR